MCFSLVCTRVVRLRRPIDAWFREHPDYSEPLELQHWSYLEALVPFFATIKAASKRPEADTYCTGSKALKILWNLRCFLTDCADEEPRGPNGALAPLATDLRHKLDEALDDPTWVWQMGFLALMDPSGEWSCVERRGGSFHVVLPS